jgi:hypothetical protein
MNKGTFFIHKGEGKTMPKQKAENIIRQSTYLQNSMIFNKFKKRDSKNSKGVKASIVMENDGFRNKRKSKTFIESDMIRNKLASAVKENHVALKISNIDQELMQQNIMLSMKSIGSFA